MIRGLPTALLCCGVLACGEQTRDSVFDSAPAAATGDNGLDDAAESPPNDADNGTGTGDAGGDRGADEDDDHDGDGGGVLLDVASGESDAGTLPCLPGEECGCTAIDILFVIDNSGSMFAFQQIIGPIFANFVDIMIDTLPPATDLHVAITTQSGFMNGSGNGNWGNDCTTDASPWPSGYLPPDEATQGGNGEQGRLYEYQGQRYYAINTDAAQAEVSAMKDWFSNAALVPPADGGNVEMMVSGAAYAFHPANAEVNAGFLRDEGAVLLIFFLTDTADISPGPGKDYELEPYADMVREAKSGCGGDKCILTAGVVDLEHPCSDTYPALPTFLEAFGKPPAALADIPQGFFLPGLGPPPPTEPFEMVLGDALASVVQQTCDAIEPEG